MGHYQVCQCVFHRVLLGVNTEKLMEDILAKLRVWN